MGKNKNSKRNTILAIVVSCIVIIPIVLLIVLPLIIQKQPEETEITTAPIVEIVIETKESETETEPETENEMLAKLAELHEENPDIVGWIRMDGTKLDYPVMYTPDDEEKYLRKNFEGNYSIAGLPFIDKDCKLDPESDNVIIYGHNMNDGTAFKALFNYEDEEYWKENPTFYYATLEEERTYEVMSVFYDRVYYKYEDVFKFYQFIEPKNKNEFNDAMANYKAKSLYDTGVTAEYGDKLLTLVTCSYHHDHGRFVVVARMLEPDELEARESLMETETENQTQSDAN